MEDGVTYEASLRQIEKSTGVHQPMLDLPELSDEAWYVWEKYVSLQKSRSYGINGPNGITHQDIEAWSRNTKRLLSLWEIDVMFLIDHEATRSRK